MFAEWEKVPENCASCGQAVYPAIVNPSPESSRCFVDHMPEDMVFKSGASARRGDSEVVCGTCYDTVIFPALLREDERLDRERECQ